MGSGYVVKGFDAGGFPSFHSISFPSEWGGGGPGDYGNVLDPSSMVCFHSISFPSEWGETDLINRLPRYSESSFHSISFPSEWGDETLSDSIKGYLETFPFN